MGCGGSNLRRPDSAKKDRMEEWPSPYEVEEWSFEDGTVWDSLRYIDDLPNSREDLIEDDERSVIPCRNRAMRESSSLTEMTLLEEMDREISSLSTDFAKRRMLYSQSNSHTEMVELNQIDRTNSDETVTNYVKIDRDSFRDRQRSKMLHQGEAYEEWNKKRIDSENLLISAWKLFDRHVERRGKRYGNSSDQRLEAI